MTISPDNDTVTAVRRFNRFHTRIVGALNEHLLASEFPLVQVRIIYELAHDETLAAADLAARLGTDRGYLSRMLGELETRGLIRKTPDPANARRLVLTLTPDGRETFARLDRASSREVEDLIAPLDAAERRRLTGAMGRIERLLGPERDADRTFVLRAPEAGDYGWIIHRHGVLYSREYGWDARFEALVAKIVAEYAETNDPAGERCWIAEREGDIVGSVFIVREDETTARLRLLYVEPSARGLGVGRRLVEECIRFSRKAGYGRVVLWTNSVLTAARKIYEAEGFELVAEKPHSDFGPELTGQTWMLEL